MWSSPTEIFAQIFVWLIIAYDPEFKSRFATLAPNDNSCQTGFSPSGKLLEFMCGLHEVRFSIEILFAQRDTFGLKNFIGDLFESIPSHAETFKSSIFAGITLRIVDATVWTIRAQWLCYGPSALKSDSNFQKRKKRSISSTFSVKIN